MDGGKAITYIPNQLTFDICFWGFFELRISFLSLLLFQCDRATPEKKPCMYINSTHNSELWK